MFVAFLYVNILQWDTSTCTTMDGLSIRLATPSDKDDVIDINRNVYDGRDYLRAYYDDFMTCPLTTPYVAILDNKIVGFLATLVVDDGETVVTRAARIHSSLSGRGLYKKLEKHALNSSKIKLHAFTTADGNPMTEKESFKSVNQLIITRPFVRFVFYARDLKSLEEEPYELLVPTDEELTAFLSNDVIRSYLCRENRFIVDWVPYRAIPANVPLFRWAPNRMKIFSDVSLSKEQRVKGLLTICTTFATQDPPFASNIDVFGTDVSSLKSHVVYHLRHIRKETEGAVSLLVYVDEEVFDMKELEKVVQSLGLKKIDWFDSAYPERKYSKVYLYEKYLTS